MRLISSMFSILLVILVVLLQQAQLLHGFTHYCYSHDTRQYQGRNKIRKDIKEKHGIVSRIERRNKHKLYFGDLFNLNKNKQDNEKDDKKEKTKDDDKDIIESLFNIFFGAKEEAPMGMARFGKDRFPEQYPATKTEFAEAVDGDDKLIANVVRPLLKNTNLETRLLELIYDANKDGWDAFQFHAKVDRRGPCVVICTTAKDQICGGYNPKGWVGYGEARGSIAAFLFTKRSLSSPETTKLIKVGGASLAQIDNPENGPSFGADSLVIPLGTMNSRLARSKLGSYYERMPDGGNSLFDKEGSSTQLKDLKVYTGVYDEGEFIPFTDAEPFALY